MLSLEQTSSCIFLLSSSSPLLFFEAPFVTNCFPPTLMTSVNSWFYVSTESLKLTNERQCTLVPFESELNWLSGFYFYSCICVLASDIMSLLFMVHKSSLLSKELLFKMKDYISKMTMLLVIVLNHFSRSMITVFQNESWHIILLMYL